jgi:cysteine-rich repeat protein
MTLGPRRLVSLAAVVFALASCGDDDGGGNQSQPNQNNNVTVPVCGDGAVEGNEECDLGAANSDIAPDTCRTDCRNPRCGDSVIDQGRGEACDDGPGNSATEPDACRPDCQPAFCGDGVIDSDNGEACDDGNTAAGDGCGQYCQSELCGDGQVDPGEGCDDGNNVSGDGCSSDCRSDETCGNGVVDVQQGEGCDAGSANAAEPDAVCRPDCQPQRCGDGIADPAAGEQCDAGAGNSDVAADTCRTTCRPAWCGDGVVDANEGCDDGINLGLCGSCDPSCLQATATCFSQVVAGWRHTCGLKPDGTVACWGLDGYVRLPGGFVPRGPIVWFELMFSYIAFSSPRLCLAHGQSSSPVTWVPTRARSPETAALPGAAGSVSGRPDRARARARARAGGRTVGTRPPWRRPPLRLTGPPGSPILRGLEALRG